LDFTASQVRNQWDSTCIYFPANPILISCTESDILNPKP
jgi:hypothetical protein